MAANQYILKVSDEQGLKHTDHMEINSCFHRYYAALYTSEPLDNKSVLDYFFHSLDISRLDPELAAKLENISLEEITEAIISMKCGKGPDGFP